MSTVVSAAALIARHATPVTAAGLAADLARLGVGPGDTLIVHTAMSRLGWVCGGAQAVIEALQNSVGPDGMIVMPAHSMDVTDPTHWENPPVPKAWQRILRENMPFYDPERTPTRGMGIVAETFRRWPGTRRSLHPAVSFSANGPDSKALLAHQPLDDPFGTPSPLSALYERSAKILMLGTTYDTCTALHLAERLAWGAHPPRHHDGAPLLIDGDRRWVEYTLPAHDTEHFEAIGAVLDRENIARCGSVGHAQTRLLSLRPTIDRARTLFPDTA